MNEILFSTTIRKKFKEVFLKLIIIISFAKFSIGEKNCQTFRTNISQARKITSIFLLKCNYKFSVEIIFDLYE